MNRSVYYNFISRKLNALATDIGSRGDLNFLDYNIHAEIFYRDFFNLLFGWNLEKTEHHNEPGIDLVDTTNSIVVSVSATATTTKIESSLSKIDPDYSGYAFKFISISKDASKLKTKSYSNPHNLKFSPTQDIYDVQALLKSISELEIDPLKAIYEFLKKELDKETTSEKLKPIDRLKNYLHDRDNWKMVENGLSQAFHYELFPEFTIVENNDFYEEYKEPWVFRFPSKRGSNQSEYFAKYHETILDKIYLVCCDDGHFLTAKPREWFKHPPLTYYYTYYFIKDSIAYLAGQIINELAGSANCRNPSIYNEFEVFDSEENVNQSFEDDFATGMRQYIYYSFNEETQQYSRIERGASSPINQ